MHESQDWAEKFCSRFGNTFYTYMSRIGKQIIAIPEKTEVSVVNGNVTVKGPLGTLSRVFRSDIAINHADGKITLEPKRNDQSSRALWGAYGSHISNMIAGVHAPYSKKLVVEGIGYKSDVKGTDLHMSLGYSHPVKLAIPTGLKVTADKNVITVTGIDKELVGQFSALIRDQKVPEPYKGKGIHYENEVVRRKQGKKTV